MYLAHSVSKLEHRKLIPSTTFHEKIFLRKNVETLNYYIFRIQIFVDTIYVPPSNWCRHIVFGSIVVAIPCEHENL